MNYGRYQIVKELGKGSMGLVYQAYDPQFDRPVALKVMRQDRTASEAYVKRFFKEARAIGRLLHPNIVTAFDAGEDRGNIYIAMEFIEGKPLDHLISEKRFDFQEVVDIGIQVAEALDYAHQKGVVHRDIKPSNMIVQPEGLVKITDFGIAHIEDVSATLQTMAGEVLGTPAYMSPEQVLGKSVDGRSDIFSLGIILYEMSTGERPFGIANRNIATVLSEIVNNEPPAPSVSNPEVDPALSQIIVKCLNKAPDQRFQTGKELADALRRCLKGGVAEVVPAPAEPIQEVRPRKRLALTGLLLTLILVAAGIVAYFYRTEFLYLLGKAAVLQIDSIPEGADVSVDGVHEGMTPLQIKLPLGDHAVRASLTGYEPWQDRVQLAEAGKTPLRIELKPLQPQASLVVETNPAGAEVYLDGVSKGRSPLRSAVPLGKHAVRISLTGYNDWNDEFQAEEAKEYPLRVQLKPVVRLAKINIKSVPTGAEVQVDGAPIGNTPIGLELPLGKHALRLSMPGYEPYDGTVQLDSAKEYPIEIKLKAAPNLAVLKIESVPSGAAVTVDGETKAKTPAHLTLPLGEHSIRLVLEDYQPWEERIAITQATEYPVRVDLQRSVKLASLKIQSTPAGAEVFVDNNPMGKTPVEQMLPVGEHSIRLSLDNYQVHEERLTLADAADLNIQLKEDIRKFQLEVTSTPKGAQVYVNETPEGKTPLGIEVPPGTYLVHLQLPDYKEWKTQVEIQDENLSLFANLIPLPKEAILNAVSRPQGAAVYVDDKPTGKKTPSKLTLTPGLHKIRLKLRGYYDSEEQVELKAAQEISLNMSLSRIPSRRDQPVTRDEPAPTKSEPGGGWIIKPPVDR